MMMKPIILLFVCALLSYTKAAEQGNLRGNHLESNIDVDDSIGRNLQGDVRKKLLETYQCIFDISDLDSYSMYIPEGVVGFDVRVSNRFLKSLAVYSFPNGFGQQETLTGSVMTLNDLKADIANIAEWHLIAIQEHIAGQTPSKDGNAVIVCPSFPTVTPSEFPSVHPSVYPSAHPSTSFSPTATLTTVASTTSPTKTPSSPPTLTGSQIDAEVEPIPPDTGTDEPTQPPSTREEYSDFPSVSPTDIPSIPPHVKERMKAMQESARGPPIPDAASATNLQTADPQIPQDDEDTENSDTTTSPDTTAAPTRADAQIDAETQPMTPDSDTDEYSEFPSASPTVVQTMPPHVREKMKELQSSTAQGPRVPEAASTNGLRQQSQDTDSANLNNSTSMYEMLQNYRNPQEPVTMDEEDPSVSSSETPDQTTSSERPVDPVPGDQVDAQVEPPFVGSSFSMPGLPGGVAGGPGGGGPGAGLMTNFFGSQNQGGVPRPSMSYTSPGSSDQESGIGAFGMPGGFLGSSYGNRDEMMNRPSLSASGVGEGPRVGWRNRRNLAHGNDVALESIHQDGNSFGFGTSYGTTRGATGDESTISPRKGGNVV